MALKRGCYFENSLNDREQLHTWNFLFSVLDIACAPFLHFCSDILFTVCVMFFVYFWSGCDFSTHIFSVQHVVLSFGLQCCEQRCSGHATITEPLPEKLWSGDGRGHFG